MVLAIIMLILSAFVISRMFRSTDMWWKLLFALVAGLLVGILSRGLAESKKDLAKASIELISPMNNETSTAYMQSLIATVTEGTIVCQSGVASYTNVDKPLFDALIKVDNHTNGRDSPTPYDTS